MQKLNAIIGESEARTPVIPAEMRAAVYRGANRMMLETVPVPEIADGELLVRIHACGVCGTDLKKIELGLVDPPRIFGHEIAGTVVRRGRSVTRFAIGDRVAVTTIYPAGIVFIAEGSCIRSANITGAQAPVRGSARRRRLRRLCSGDGLDRRGRHNCNSR